MTLLCALVTNASLLSLSAFPLESGTAIQQADRPTVAAGQVADLQEQLENGLRIRRPEEFRFIENIVQMTKEGRLPVELVLSTFQYVRTKKKDESHLFVIFERVLRLRAAKIGIALPAVR